MSEDRLILAIGRLERGLARVEAAAARRSEAPPPAPDRSTELAALGERHERLKTSVERAIAALDRLIDKS